ncbi:MAG TPA: ABC transporter ATP-binding protein [Anaerolineaceae bacterium]|nr:ABC transporter ATP-binding protein [Anaerolineaceae bacterium]
MLKIENLSKVYRIGTFGGKELQAVRNVSFDIHDGQVVSLIGESGSGKSTIGRMILRLIAISGGTIWHNGVDIATLEGPALKAYYRKVQGVFQDPFSSYNPVFKADRIFSMVHDEFFPQVSAAAWYQKVCASLEQVGLNPDHCLNKYPHQLSGGQLQRLLIARALLLNVQLLVADEIISMLDASTRIDVLNLLAGLKASGLSVLFITHDLSLGYYISERAVILYRGRVVEMGATERIYANPLHPYTRMLMASVPRLDAKWADVGQRLEAGGRQPVAANGCIYAARCPCADGGCAEAEPPLVEVAPDHFVACCKVDAQSPVAASLPAEAPVSEET